ncbi:MAG TPA: DUF3592 domain-containing protein [Anaerolineales bacterium]|nr:DUF3592 domain-containing protein [Anaerolineales bacterium]
MSNDDRLNEAIRLIKTGRKAEAQLLLEPYIQDNPQNINAWMWEAELFSADCDKAKVMEICLEHNPGQPQVSRALAVLRTRAGLPAEPLPQPPVPVLPETPGPAISSGNISREPPPLPAAAPVPDPLARATPRTPPPNLPIPKKYPDWPTVAGVVDRSGVRAVRSRYGPTYYAEIVALYVVDGKDFTIRHPWADKGSVTAVDEQILAANYPVGTGVWVSYHPKNPRRACIDEWDVKYTKAKLKAFKQKPEMRKALARKYRGRMLSGLLWAGGGIAATVIASLIFSQLGVAYVVFTGAIIVGIINFFSGLFGWLKYM